MQGPITVFENNTYAGDSRILDLQPGEERLLSYAIDLGTEVEATPQETNSKLTKVKLNKGLLYTTTKIHEGKNYKPSERARDVYRFEIKLAAGKTASTEVAEEHDVTQAVQLSNSDDQTMRYF